MSVGDHSDHGLSTAIARLVRDAYVEAARSDEMRGKAFEAALRVYLEHNDGVPTKEAGRAVAAILVTFEEGMLAG
jgi:hypothetical protein